MLTAGSCQHFSIYVAVLQNEMIEPYRQKK